jgi:predicted AlkP superfamily phosphohydrolase/phosphomutase
MSRCRVLVLGLDSVPPELAFEHHADVMPRLAKLKTQGAFGPLRSTDPPITIPAWTTLLSGRDPGELGLYGFRCGRHGSYEMETATAHSVRAPRLWDLASRAGLRSVVVGVPPSYPVLAPPGCVITGCFLTPSSDSRWIDPPDLRAALEKKHGAYLVDVEAHRKGDRAAILEGARALTTQRFAILRELVAASDPHLAVVVDIGPDRLHHGLLASLHSGHPRHRPDDPLLPSCRAYYALLDEEIGRTIDAAGGDPLVLVCSDHGVQPLLGGLCLNDWLIGRGDLVLHERPTRPTSPLDLKVDWDRTRVIAYGGHYGRLRLNLKGREPCGILSPSDAPALLDELQSDLERMSFLGERPMANRVLHPSRIYRQTQGMPPDLLVYCDDLRLRALGSAGHGPLVVHGNDTGEDEANHSLFGMFVASGGGLPWKGLTAGQSLESMFEVLRRALLP